jgi:hypothetical protein
MYAAEQLIDELNHRRTERQVSKCSISSSPSAITPEGC